MSNNILCLRYNNDVSILRAKRFTYIITYCIQAVGNIRQNTRLYNFGFVNKFPVRLSSQLNYYRDPFPRHPNYENCSPNQCQLIISPVCT